MRRCALLLALGLPLLTTPAGAQSDAGPPHAWSFGSWTGGVFPAGETSGPACSAVPVLIITRDIVLRASVFDVAYRQRTIETVASNGQSLEFRFTPAPPVMTPLGPTVPPDSGFGCPDGPDVMRVDRLGPDELVLRNCRDFPATLRRCTP